MVGAARSLQSNSSRDVLSSKLFSFKCSLRPLQLLELFAAVKSQLIINKAGSVEFSVSLQMHFLSYCLSLTWVLIGFWGQIAIEITLTQNSAANSVLCKPLVGKMVLEQLLAF